MFVRLGLILRSALHSIALWALIIVLQFMLIVPLFQRYSTGFVGEQYAIDSAIALREQNRDNPFPGMPDDLKAMYERRYAAIDRLAVASTDAELVESLAQYYAVCLEMAESDYSDEDNSELARMNAEYYAALAAIDDPQIYDTYSEVPALLYLGNVAAITPYVIWVLPGLMVAFFTLQYFDRGRLLARAPLSGGRQVALTSVALIVLSLGVVVLVLMPAFIAACIKNGLGNPAYPVMFAQPGTVVHTTAAGLVARVILQFALITICVSFIAHALFQMAQRALVGTVVTAVLAIIPMFIQNMFQTEVNATAAAAGPATAGSSWLAWCPFFYFLIPNTAGFFSYGGQVSSSYPAPSGASFERGMLLLLVMALFAVVVSCAFAMWSKGLKGRRSNRTAKVCVQQALSARNVTIGYGANELLGDVTFDIAPGCILGLVAPNGHGKTSLLTSLAGDRRCLRGGVIEANGVFPADRGRFARLVFFAPGDASCLYRNLTVLEHLQLVHGFWGGVPVKRVVSACDIESYVRKPSRKLSQGMKQQVVLALAYASGARYLLLDEPMNALDPTHVRLNNELLRAQAAQGKGIILSSHILGNVDELCDEVVFIADRKLVGAEGDASTEELYRKLYEQGG